MANSSKKNPGTETSSFGSSGRVNHNADKFYNSRLYEGMQQDALFDTRENEIPAAGLDRLYCKSSEIMEEIPEQSVHLMVTSPPYNASKEYDQDLSLPEYLGMLQKVWRETYRVLAPGGRACINVANLGRRPYIPLHSYMIRDMLEAGFLMRGEIIWDKGSSSSVSTAWGSWKSASNPVLRDVHEYILVFSKGSYGRKGHAGESTISKEDFLAWTRSVWSFPAVSARKIGHPAPFPQELPHRLIQLFTFKDEVVLDPFVGSGTTCLAAVSDGRHYIGYDTSEEYLKLAQQRINACSPSKPAAGASESD